MAASDTSKLKKPAPVMTVARLERELEAVRGELEAAKKTIAESDQRALNLNRDIDAITTKLKTRERELSELTAEHQRATQTLRAKDEEVRNLQIINLIMLVMVVAAVLIFGGLIILT